MLAAYYNTYGDWYYPLQTQGGPGQEDKETFAAAALVMNESLYTVSYAPGHLGQPGNGAVMLQGDPREDFDLNSAFNSPSSSSSSTNETAAVALPNPAPFFIHAGWPPKLNALQNIRSARQFKSEQNSIDLFGEDIEPVV
jgi:alpha 1,2-mannosyltransferase